MEMVFIREILTQTEVSNLKALLKMKKVIVVGEIIIQSGRLKI